MNDFIKFRSVTLNDALMLLDWRNNIDTRQASHSSEVISLADHLAWLQQSLQNTSRRLLVAEYNHDPIGTIRADLQDGRWMLSWTIAPEARGKGYAKSMVALFIAQLAEPVAAEVKVNNIASVKIAEHAGLVLTKREGDVLLYAREALN